MCYVSFSGDGRRPLASNNNHLEEPPKDGRASSIPTSPSLPSRLRSPNASSNNLTRLARRTSGENTFCFLFIRDCFIH